MIHTLAVFGYRSLRDLVLPLDQLTVVTGANGVGKSSLYRALRLLCETAEGNLARALAAEGGLPSTLWAGPETISREMREGLQPVQGTRRKAPVALKLGFSSDDFGYAVDMGLPIPVGGSRFNADPEIKSEAVWAGQHLKRTNVLAERRRSLLRVRDENGHWTDLTKRIPGFDSMLGFGVDPRTAPELIELRERMRNWRFYDDLRVDREAAVRQPQVSIRTPVLSSSGHDLAAAIETIREIGDHRGFAETIDDAFPETSVKAVMSGDATMVVEMSQHGLLRPLRASELSDGTLRFLMLAAALHTPRPPELLVLNEPESSLHPDLIAPLSRLIGKAATRSQVIVITHNRPMANALCEEGALSHELVKTLGETEVPAAEKLPWKWPDR